MNYLINDNPAIGTVTMRVGYDMSSDRIPESAIVNDGSVTFRIIDPFAAYLAARNNTEVAEYLHVKAEEIRLFLHAMEARVTDAKRRT